MAISIGLRGLCRRFGDQTALAPLDLDIRAGEFFTLLGSSGSGKSTLLKLIGGFDQPSAGTVSFDGTDVTRLPANRRQCNTVFQDLALFPHMSVEQNVAYGLRVRRESRADCAQKVAEALKLVALEGYQRRAITALSGGQRQRVALARSLVMEPGILLLDEPLTGLDERLRQQMRDEFGRLHRKTGATFVLVTHNQDEAMSLSDRMGIMHHGRLEQVGTPFEILHRPANEFVARFVGLESILTPERVMRDGERLAVMIAGQRFDLADYREAALPGKIALRSDRIRIVADPGGGGLSGLVTALQFRGLHYECSLDLRGAGHVTAIIPSVEMPRTISPGSEVGVILADGALVPVMEQAKETA
ncbi:ABC transporter ATP-binding protein [Xinfangfangia sp. D13-10-4-6]|uniref:ABC transporter ATP-binding protein n=1 Tax=Pseudogemmobacter hezensis TaxID=2737662 RepID=UPI001554D9CD|nr:ABC transporter ATP-binding protein [Pseudogemmobacter hezensis]NPD16748.1 ABC transporter ATP-binding protein [Pseudogemmobacter hezensis]